MFDAGRYEQALAIANSLRTLFHTPRREGIPLFKQLGMLDGPWLDYSFPFPADQAGMDCCHLTTEELAFADGMEARVRPILDHRPFPLRGAPFKRWWIMPIGHSAHHGSLSREDVVLGLANKEGAHASAEVTEKALALRQGTFLQVQWFSGDTKGHFPFVAHAAARTIAHEVLVTLANRHRRAFREAYKWNPEPGNPAVMGFSAFDEPKIPPGAQSTA